VQYKNIFGDDFQWNQVSCQNLFRSGGGDASPYTSPLCPRLPLHSANSKTNKERVTEFLYQAVELPTSDCSIFTENEGLVQIKVTITDDDFGPDYKLHQPKFTDRPQVNIHCIQTFLPFAFFEQRALALKTVSPENFHCIEIYFIIQDFWATSACLENRVCPEIFQARVGAPPSHPPPRTPMVNIKTQNRVKCPARPVHLKNWYVFWNLFNHFYPQFVQVGPLEDNLCFWLKISHFNNWLSICSWEISFHPCSQNKSYLCLWFKFFQTKTSWD